MDDGGSVLIADDDESRKELGKVLEAAGLRVTEAATGIDALAKARATAPAAVILEIPLTGLSGYEVCRALKAEFGAAVAVMFLTGARTESYDKVAGLLLGADDYVVKPYAPDEILARVRNLLARVAAPAKRSRLSLTQREREILTLLSEGLQQREIARRLFISPKTVATHVENLTRKMGVHSRTQAVAVAFREELVPAGRRSLRGRQP